VQYYAEAQMASLKEKLVKDPVATASTPDEAKPDTSKETYESLHEGMFSFRL